MKKIQAPFKARVWLIAGIAVAGSVLSGCGGGTADAPGAAPNEQPQAIQISEFNTALAVKSDLSRPAAARSASSASGVESSNESSSETRSAQYTLTASANGATLLQGTLALRGESEDGGALELKGRLVPAAGGARAAAPGAPAASAVPSSEALAAFKAARAASKETLRAAIEAARAAYAAASAGGTSRDAARTSFKATVADAVTSYRTAISQAAAIAGLQVRHEDTENAVSLAQQGIDRALQSITDVRG